MSKKKIIVLSVLLAAVLIAATVAYNQKSNIKALVTYSTVKTEDISNEIAQSKEAVNEALADYDLPYVRDFTPEEELMLMKGEITYEEAIENIKSESNSSEDIMSNDSDKTDNTKKNTSSKKGNSTESSSAEKSNSSKDEIGELVGELYNIKAYYLGELGAVMGKMKAEYAALPPEQKTTSAKVSIVENNLSYASSLESECDAKVYAIIEKIKAKNPSLADTIANAYEDEKALKKAYYLSSYK
ncbi:MAG: hypothetical protein IJ736_08110 [Firmicutes bacterium]|nr:hypothetical protein [Bacillota bacterium]